MALPVEITMTWHDREKSWETAGFVNIRIVAFYLEYLKLIHWHIKLKVNLLDP